VRFYAHRGYPIFDPAACEELAFSAFIQGLSPQRPKEHLHITVQTTFSTALKGRKGGGCDVLTQPTKVHQTDISNDEGDIQTGVVCQALPSPARQPLCLEELPLASSVL